VYITHTHTHTHTYIYICFKMNNAKFAVNMKFGEICILLLKMNVLRLLWE